jgi:hypothetical protein
MGVAFDGALLIALLKAPVLLIEGARSVGRIIGSASLLFRIIRHTHCY